MDFHSHEWKSIRVHAQDPEMHLSFHSCEWKLRWCAAEVGGFEPPRALTQPAFQASAIGH